MTLETYAFGETARCVSIPTTLPKIRSGDRSAVLRGNLH